MDRTKIYCLFYILLLTMTTPALCAKQQMEKKLHSRAEVESDDDTKVRARRSVAPIALYAGAVVSPWVWAALVAAYGLALVISYGITETSSDSHNCANNRGWCRDSCFGHEYADWYHSAVCGDFVCCRPK